MDLLNKGFDRLRGVLPGLGPQHQLSKYETLQLAQSYISELSNLLQEWAHSEISSQNFNKLEVTKAVDTELCQWAYHSAAAVSSNFINFVSSTTYWKNISGQRHVSELSDLQRIPQSFNRELINLL